MKTIAERIKKALNDSGHSGYSIEAATGGKVSASTVFRIETGKSKNPRFKTLELISEVINADPTWLLTGEGNASREMRPVVVDYGEREDRIYLDEFDVNGSCGNGDIVFFDLPDSRKRSYRSDWFTNNRYNPSDCFTVRAKGDSMARYINDGNSVTVNKSLTTVHEGEAYFIWWADSYWIKYIERVDENTIHLVSENSAKYPPKVVNIDNGHDFRVIGQVVDRSGK